MDNYRRFLELQQTDPKLRAEALRRLGDLNLESGEFERMEKEVTQIDIQGARGDQALYDASARPIRIIRATMRCSTSWRAPTRRRARTMQALATLDRVVKSLSAEPAA